MSTKLDSFMRSNHLKARSGSPCLHKVSGSGKYRRERVPKTDLGNYLLVTGPFEVQYYINGHGPLVDDRLYWTR